LMGGEAVSDALSAALLRCADMAVYNVYGPTECTVDATCARLRAELPGAVIGRPLANVRTYLLDGRGRPVLVGATGELYIGGEGVARGYLNRRELTAEKFVPDPFSGRPGSRLYRTGDLARYRPDGNLEFLGRAD